MEDGVEEEGKRQFCVLQQADPWLYLRPEVGLDSH